MNNWELFVIGVVVFLFILATILFGAVGFFMMVLFTIFGVAGYIYEMKQEGKNNNENRKG